MSEKVQKHLNLKYSHVLLISITIYLLMFVIFIVYTTFIDPSYSILISDQLVFEIRGEGILDGKIPYRDFPTDAAPLSPYLWAPFVFIKRLTGIGLEYSLRVFFMICIIFSGWILYRIESFRNNKNAELISLLFTINPFFLYLFSFWGSDECIVPLLILLPIYFFERENYIAGTFFIAIGAGLKYFPILLAPIIWYYLKNWKQRVIYSTAFILFIASFVIPFLILCRQQFLNQFKDPATSPGNQGIVTILSVGYNLNLGMVPEIMRIAFLLTEIFVALWILVMLQKGRKWHYRYTASFFLIFLLLYKKIQESYIVTVFPFATVSLFQNKKEGIIALTWFIIAIAFGQAAFYVIENALKLSFLLVIAWIVVVSFYIILVVYLAALMTIFNKKE